MFNHLAGERTVQTAELPHRCCHSKGDVVAAAKVRLAGARWAVASHERAEMIRRVRLLDDKDDGGFGTGWIGRHGCDPEE